jgi:Protein of unknown function (DUF3106)
MRYAKPHPALVKSTLGLSSAAILILLSVSPYLRAQTAAVPSIPQTVSTQKVNASGPVTPLPKTPWKNLSAADQQALTPLQGQWESMEGSRQRKWLDLAARYKKATPDQQKRMQERMQAWATITPEQRKLARENYQAVRKLDPNTRAEKWSSYEQLPVEKRIELHNKVEEQRQQRGANSTNTGKPTIPAEAPKPGPQGMQGKPRVVAAPGGLVDQNTLLPAAKPAQSTQ